MHFSILGAGALGTILAAHLVRSGHDVIVLARGKRAQFLRTHGLIVHGLAELRARCEVAEDPAQLRSTDCLIIGTKAIDTLKNTQALAHVQLGCVFSMQNGVIKDELLAQVFGPAAVVGAMADFSGELLGNGEVLFTRNVALDLGEIGGDLSQRVTTIASTIDAAGVRCTAVPDIRTREWSKFVAWAGMLPLAALTRLNSWRYLLDEQGAQLAVRLVREVGQLAQTLQIPLRDQSPLPAVTLIRGSEREAVATVQEIGRRFRENAPEHRMSALQDIERGTPLEIDETLGFAVRKAEELGLPVPTLKTCYQLLKIGR